MRVRIELSLVLSELSTMREPSWTTSPPMIAGSTLIAISTLPPPEISVSHLRPRDTFSRIIEQIETTDHVGDREEPALGRDKLDEIRRGSADLHLREKGGERFHLIIGGKNRALDETLEVGAILHQLREGGKIVGGLFRRPGLLTEREKRLGITPRHPRYECFLIRQHQPLNYFLARRPASKLAKEKPRFHGECREILCAD
jgi:hypothetical protein